MSRGPATTTRRSAPAERAEPRRRGLAPSPDLAPRRAPRAPRPRARPAPLPRVVTIADRDMPLLAAITARLGLCDGVEADLHPYDGAASLARVLDACRPPRRVLVVLKLTSAPRRNAPLLDAVDARGLRVLNSTAAVRLCERRKATFAYLGRALPRLPTPAVYRTVGAARAALDRGRRVLVRADLHNIPKPERLVGVADSAPDLARLLDGRAPAELILQEWVETAEPDVYKVYAIGSEVTTLRTVQADVFGARGPADRLEPCATPVEVRRWVGELRRVLGLEVFGLDCIRRADGGLCVVDLNDFPNYGGVAGALDLLTRHLVRALARRGG